MANIQMKYLNESGEYEDINPKTNSSLISVDSNISSKFGSSSLSTQDILSVLADFNDYWWTYSQTVYTPSYGASTTFTLYSWVRGSSIPYVSYSISNSISCENGVVSLVNASTSSCRADKFNTSVSVYGGQFIKIENTIVRAASTVSWSMDYYDGTSSLNASNVQSITVRSSTQKTLLHSSNRNQYSDNTNGYKFCGIPYKNFILGFEGNGKT